MALVVDASVAAAWCFDDESGSAGARRLLKRLNTETGLVPAIFWYEIRNVLLSRERRSGGESANAEVFMRRLEELDLEEVRGHRDDAVLDLARRHGLTIYDAAYLDLAIRRSASLATLDRRMAVAAKAEGLLELLE